VKYTKTTLIVVAALALVACGGSGSSAPTTIASETSVPTADSQPAGTTATTATTAGSTTAGESTTTSTTIPADPVMPLTGLPISDPALAARPALVVKIDNHPDARPQSGLNQADIVFEENVEQLTRFAAVFQTTNPDPVGPIRSGREQDVQLLGSLNKPIFAWSGGNAGVTAAINGSDFVVANVQTNARKASKSYRSNRAVPHNLYAQGSGLFTMAPDGATPPPQQFSYLKAGQSAAGDSSTGVELAMDGVKVKWTYDTKSATYLRFQSGKAHNDAALGQVNATNVVVVVVDYVQSKIYAPSPIAQTLGTGEAYLFTGGKMVHGKWSRDDRLKPFTLTADDGKPMLLTPGRTWVELARVDSTTPAT
jgi:Protein of unknown function (DUF3048) N-terminal domain/Protein of unknown function (DUF3048) C-terminal domain